MQTICKVNTVLTGEHSKYSKPLEVACSRPCLVDITLLCLRSVFMATKVPRNETLITLIYQINITEIKQGQLMKAFKHNTYNVVSCIPTSFYAPLQAYLCQLI